MAQRSEVSHHIVRKLPTVNHEAEFRGKMIDEAALRVGGFTRAT